MARQGKDSTLHSTKYCIQDLYVRLMRDKKLARTFTYHDLPALLNIVLIDTQLYNCTSVHCAEMGSKGQTDKL